MAEHPKLSDGIVHPANGVMRGRDPSIRIPQSLEESPRLLGIITGYRKLPIRLPYLNPRVLANLLEVGSRKMTESRPRWEKRSLSWAEQHLLLPSRKSATRTWMNSSSGPSRSFGRISLPFFNLTRRSSVHQFIRIFGFQICTFLKL